MLFVNTTHPFLRIYNPATGGYAQFQGGKLEIDEDDPDFAVVKAEAERNPLISIMVNATTCPDCGALFDGKAAPALLGKHRKEVHFDKWVAERTHDQAQEIQVEVKARSGFACDICGPQQTFGDADGLARHVRYVHAAVPKLDEEGNDLAEEGRGGAVVSDEIPAAKPRGG